MLFPLVCACEHVCVCVSSHVRDSPLILSLDSCLHAYFLYVTTLSVTHQSETAARLPSITHHMPTASSYSKSDSHRAQFKLLLGKMPPFSVEKCLCFSNSSPKLWTENYVFASAGGQINFWISNLSNRSHWRNSKATRPVWRGTARLLLRWPFMLVAAQRPFLLCLRSPISPHISGRPHTNNCVLLKLSTGNIIMKFISRRAQMS